jgi:signal transduction histidine kinase
MKRTFNHIALICVAVISLGLLLSCQQANKVGQGKHVLILLSYDSQHCQYADYVEEMERTIEYSGFNADCKVIYLDLEYSPDEVHQKLAQINDSLSRMGWMPHAIVTEDDRAARILLSEQSAALFDVQHVPVVLGSIQFPQIINIKGRDNICMWKNPIDYVENIQLACKLAHSNQVQIELDNYIYDNLIRRELNDAISRPPYVRNFNGELGMMNDHLLSTRYQDSIVVTTLRIDNGLYDISNPNDSIVKRREQIRTFLKLSSNYPSLVVKKDLYADAIANKSDRPQFTAIASDFDDGMGSYLAGYFASYSTIAHDCGLTVARIFNGAKPSALSGQTHQKYFWMDFNAMQKLGMAYEDYADKYRIVNAPFAIQHSTLYWIIIVSVVLAVIAIVLGILYGVNKLRHQIQEERLMTITRSRNISRLCLNSIENMPIETVEDLEKYMSFVHPKSQDEVDKMRDEISQPGKYSHLVYCAPRGDQRYQWWEFRYDITPHDIVGLIINKQETVDLQERINRVMKHTAETSRKETFFSNLSKELKKPLDAICGACDRLVEEKLSEKERQAVLKQLQDSSEFAGQEIGDILLFSRIESGRLRYMFTEKNAGEFLKVFYQEMTSRIPSQLKFTFNEGRPSVFVTADFDRLHDVLLQFMRNAIKFTHEGEIVLGWHYHLNEHMCEFFVEDTGVGIDAVTREKLFDLFWKSNDMSEGVGLGLNICRSLAEAMKGNITVSSAPGKGSRFSVWMPARAETLGTLTNS